MVDSKVNNINYCKILSDIGFWTPFWFGILGPCRQACRLRRRLLRLVIWWFGLLKTKNPESEYSQLLLMRVITLSLDNPSVLVLTFSVGGIGAGSDYYGFQYGVGVSCISGSYRLDFVSVHGYFLHLCLLLFACLFDFIHLNLLFFVFNKTCHAWFLTSFTYIVYCN